MIELVTGTPGAGKSLYTVAEKLTAYLEQRIEHNGVSIPRRLVVGGIRDLLIEHELMDVPKWDVEASPSPHADLVREPGDAPLDVPRSALNWWAWCEPGDVIVIDECQTLFRPVAAGRKVPPFIAKLETHRHYGVDFVIITQHPQLIHTNVRNLIGKHEHVRRVWGGASTLVYLWDHCTHPDRTKSAQVRHWRHKKAAFGLYKSAEVHTKQRHSKPFALYLAIAGLIGGAAASVYAAQSIFATPEEKLAKANAQQSQAAASPGEVAPVGAAQGNAAPPVAKPHPRDIIVGAFAMGGVWHCVNAAGFRMLDLPSWKCAEWAANPPPEYWQKQAAPPPPVPPQAAAPGAAPTL